MTEKNIEGPYGTPHGGARGKVWITGEEIEIDIEGQKMIAGLLEEEAPKTCRAFLRILPYEGEVLHMMWSGDGFQTHGSDLEKMAEDNSLVMENFSAFAARGDLQFWVRDRGLFFCYGYMHSRGNTGEEPGNLFAHVKPEYYPALYEIGRRIFREGKKKITIRHIQR